MTSLSSPRVSARRHFSALFVELHITRKDYKFSEQPSCQVAVRRLLYTGASVARFLGVSTSLVNRMANIEAADLDSYIESSL